MSDPTDQDKPLNAYDLKVIGDYVATLKYPAPNKSTMPEKPPQLELIESVYRFIDRVSDLINTEITAAVGIQADWQYWTGVDSIPQEYSKNFSPERFKRLSDLWTLREEANGFCASLDEYKPHEWAKELYNSAQQKQPVEESTAFKNELARLQRDYDKSKAILQRTHDDHKKSSEQEFRCLKAEIITSLRAIDLCILASLCTEKQHLTHRQRNFRMRHVHQIITNEVDRFGDRKLTNYEDDF